MKQNDAIVNPAIGIDAAKLGPFGVMLSAQGDLDTLCRMMNLGQSESKPLFTSKIYVADDSAGAVSLAGPFIGAPYAAMILEALIAGGVRFVLFFGWCGAISPHVRIGDLLVPTAAIIDEGTSMHYHGNISESRPSEALFKKLTGALRSKALSYHEGRIWSTDAVFRETKHKVRDYQMRKVLAVDMEASALFTVGSFRKIDVVGVLAVSDELSSLRWNPGFKNTRFKQVRTAVCEVIKSLCLQEYPRRSNSG
ncbi:MAG: nucleoside phosphorylase [Desulfobacterales bacterium]|jgi:uridine phosphorylase